LATPWKALKVKDRPEVHPHGVLTDDLVSVLLGRSHTWTFTAQRKCKRC